VCYYHDEYVYSAKKFECKKKEPKYFEIEIKQGGHYYILLNQVDYRIYPDSMSKPFP
jgi:hypothetical protein